MDKVGENKEVLIIPKKLEKNAVEILDMISGGADEKTVCDHFLIRRGTFVQWMITYPEFESAVIEARRQRADSFRSIIQNRMYDDDGKFIDLEKDQVPGEKLIFEKLKWLAEMDNPDKYGKKVNHEGGIVMPVQISVDTGIRNNDSKETKEDKPIETESVEVKEESFKDMDF